MSDGDDFDFDRDLDVVARGGGSDKVETTKNLKRIGIGGIGLFILGVIAASLALPTLVVGLLISAGFVGMRIGGMVATSGTSRKRQAHDVPPSPKRVRVDKVAKELCVEGEQPIPLEAIKKAYFQPRRGEGRESVRCVGDGNVILFEAEVDQVSDGAELLAALGHDAVHRRAQFAVQCPISQTPMRRLGTMLGTIGLVIAYNYLASALAMGTRGVWAGSIALAVLPIFAMAHNATVEVGLDGLLLQWLTTRRFLSYENIERVELEEMAIIVTLRDWQIVRLVLPNAIKPTPEDRLDRNALFARIEEARKAHRSSKLGSASITLPSLVERITRGARDVQRWRADLAQLLKTARQSGYREAVTREEDLWQIVEDSSAPEDARAAAALLLRSSNDANKTPRLRVAAEAIASPRLRVAFETVADPDAKDQSIDEAFATFDDDDENNDAKKQVSGSG